MSDVETLRKGVEKSLPELALIGDSELRFKVAQAWAIALSETEYTSIEDIRASALPDDPLMKRGTQADHIRATAQIALAQAEAIERVFGSIGIDHDLLLAGALVHDVGKPYEFSPRNQARWKADPSAAGLPAVRHPVYGVHIALQVGLPEPVVHIVGAHAMSREGACVKPSLENVIVQYADSVMWRVFKAAGLIEPEND